jgi:outer membrane lipoprotein-sorting protein
LTSTPDELNARIAGIYDATSSFQAKTDMTARLGSVYRSASVDVLNESFTAYVLFRKAATIRILGKVPVVGTTAFDMVSTGTDFRLFLSPKNLFVTGLDSDPTVSPNAIENLRPHELLAAMLIQPADLQTERVHIQDDTDVDHSWYVLQIARKGPGDTDLPGRSVWFDRLDLHIIRQRIFDADGLIVSDTKYDKWKSYGGVMFPAHIDAGFKKDGYGLVINTSDLQMNPALADDKFALEQPAGSKLKVIGGSRLPVTGQ